MGFGTPSGTSAYNISSADVLLDSFERCGVYQLEPKHVHSGKRSANLLNGRWATRGINLWTIDPVPFFIDLIQGAPTYDLPASTVQMWDTYVRSPLNPVVITGQGPQSTVIPMLLGEPVAQDTVFNTTAGSNIIACYFPKHGLVAGQAVSLLYPVIVGGLTLGGIYNVITVVDANNYTLNSTFNATSTSTTTIQGFQGQDILMTPISRNDYAAIPQKYVQGRPTTYWFDRQAVIPQVTVWPIPDASGPYQLQTYLMRKIFDVTATGGETLDMPNRFFYAYVMGCAADLSMKWAPDRWQLLNTEAGAAWAEASNDDREKVSLFLRPMLEQYGSN